MTGPQPTSPDLPPCLAFKFVSVEFPIFPQGGKRELETVEEKTLTIFTDRHGDTKPLKPRGCLKQDWIKFQKTKVTRKL